MDKNTYEYLAEAYNNFDARPLKGENLKKFFVDDFTKEITKRIVSTAKTSGRFKKILVTGHTGCGKSTILNKAIEVLEETFHIVSFSVADELNLRDIQTIDILMIIYIQLLSSIEEDRRDPFIDKFKKIVSTVKDFNIREIDLNLVAFKIKVESESREAVRTALNTKITDLVKNISDVCLKVSKEVKKEILIIIDDIDKLPHDSAKQIFVTDVELIGMPKAKIIFTFPLASFYSPSFNDISDTFHTEYIRLVNLYDIDGNLQQDRFKSMQELVSKRMNRTYLDDEALKDLIVKSGGVIRHLVKFMQDACHISITQEFDKINSKVAATVIQEKINEYNRIFDSAKYRVSVERVLREKTKNNIPAEEIIHLLRHRFVLEYGELGKESWFDVHPCLEKSLKREQHE